MVAMLIALVLAPPASLPARQGWHVDRARLKDAGCAGCLQTWSRASTVPYRDAPNDLPHRTMAALPRRGIIILVSRSWEPSPPGWMHRRRPLRIVSAAITASFEGNTTNGRVSRWQASTWRAGSFVTVYVLFGSPVPAPATVARAQAELDGTTFDPWIVR